MNRAIKAGYTPAQIAMETEAINALSHYEMCRLYRFAPTGHNWFRGDLPFYDIFMARFNSLGGWTPEMSKRVGWDNPNAENAA